MTSSTVSGGSSKLRSNGMSALMRKLAAARAAAPAKPETARRRPLGGSSAELAADDVLAAQVARLFAEVERPRHGGPHPVRRRPCRSPSVGERHHFFPVVRTLRNVGGIIELIELGRVF